MLVIAVGFGLLSFSTSAAKYLISPSATTAGAEITYKNEKYVVGTTAFANFSALASANPESNSTIQVAPGTYSENVTFKTSGLTFLGNNAYCDWTATRASESIITGTIALEANNMVMNGFKLIGNGRFVSESGTNAAPLSGIDFIYNYSTGSTLARNWGTPVMQIGKRVTNADANATSSQRRYKDCDIAHNYFEGDASHYAVSIAMAGVFGTTRVFDNKFVDGGTSIVFDNAQGDIRVKFNRFKDVGVSTSTSPDGGTKGDFCIAFYRGAYANSTTLDIKGNEFDGVYGQGSYFTPIRIYPGSSTNLVDPQNLKVNINQNTFKNKTSKSENSGQLGENILMYADKASTKNVKFELSDNHFDNRFYKFAWVTLADGIGQREVYSNASDQFTFGGTYSTMGNSTFYGVDISNHAKNVKTGAVTVLQSMDIDMQTGDMYFLQLMGNTAANAFCSKHGLSSSNCDPLVITRVKCTKKGDANGGKFVYSTTVEKMNIAKSGHGVKLQVCRDKNGQLWLITGGRGDDNGTGNDVSGSYIARFKFQAGKDLILNGSGKTDSEVVYFKHPAGKSNAYGAVDEMNRYLCVSSSGGGYQYYIYDLDEYLEGSSSPTFIKSVALKSGADPIEGSGASGDTGFIKWSYQSYCINGDYLYMLEGVATTVSGHAIIISTYNWRTDQFLKRTHVTYDRILSTFGEPEAITIRPDEFGNVCCYLGTAAGAAGSRTQNVFKYHIDRHLDSTGAVIGGDTSTAMKHFNTSQYSGIKMSPSATSISLSAASVSEYPTSAVTITRTSKYMFSSWFGTITGEDGNVFSVSLSGHNQFSGSFKATVKFTPDGRKKTYKANLRLSSAGANDIIIPITATYTGETGVEPEPEPTPDPTTPTITATPESFTLTGTYLASDAPYVDVIITGSNLTQDIIFNSQSSSVIPTTLSDWNPRTGGTLRCTLNTNFVSGVSETEAFIAVQSGTSATPEARILINFVATLTEGEAPSEDIEITELTEKWIYSVNKGNLGNASWFSSADPKTRDMCFADGKLYVLNTTASEPSVTILDAYTGEKVGNLSVSGIAGADDAYILSGVKSLGNTVIGSNFCWATGTLRVYKWDSDSSNPELFFEDSTQGMELGRSFNTYGDMTDGIIVYGNTTKVVYYRVVDGVVDPEAKIVTADLGGNASNQSVAFESDGSFWVDNKDQHPIYFNADGVRQSQLSADIAGQIYGAAIKAFTYGNHNYIAFTSTLGSTSQKAWGNAVLKLVDVTDKSAPIAKGTYPVIGLGPDNWGTVGTNAVDYEIAENGNLNIWVMVPVQGIAMYQFAKATTGIEDFETEEIEMPVEWYNLQGVRVDAENILPGIYIRRQGNNVTKVLVK